MHIMWSWAKQSSNGVKHHEDTAVIEDIFVREQLKAVGDNFLTLVDHVTFLFIWRCEN